MIFILACTFLTVCNVTGQTLTDYKVRKSIVQTFPAEEITSISLEIEGQVDVQVWGQSSVCVQTSVIPEKASFKMIKMLADEGYYDIIAQDVENVLTVATKQPISKLMEFRGERQVTCIEYKVYVPEGVQVTDVMGRDLLVPPVAVE